MIRFVINTTIGATYGVVTGLLGFHLNRPLWWVGILLLIAVVIAIETAIGI